MPQRANRRMVQQLIENGGELAEIVSGLVPELRKLVPHSRFLEIKAALAEWDCGLCEINEALLVESTEVPKSERRTRPAKVA